MTVIIAVGNQKGGVGKTNTTVTLAHGLALHGYSVLCVDLDTQGHLAVCLGMDKGDDLVRLMRGQVTLKWAAQPTGREHLDVIRSDSSTADFKNELANKRFREQALSKVLRVPSPYDVILLDCAPSRDVLLDAAIMAADWLLIPAKLDDLSADGIGEILSTLTELREYGATCELLAIIPTMLNRSKNEPYIQLKALTAGFGARVWPLIPQDSRVEVANREGSTLWELQPLPRALAGYSEVLSRLEASIK